MVADMASFKGMVWRASHGKINSTEANSSDTSVNGTNIIQAVLANSSNLTADVSNLMQTVIYNSSNGSVNVTKISDYVGETAIIEESMTHYFSEFFLLIIFSYLYISVSIYQKSDGLSLKSQFLYALVFITRYLPDLFVPIFNYETIIGIFLTLVSIFIIGLYLWKKENISRELSEFDKFSLLSISSVVVAAWSSAWMRDFPETSQAQELQVRHIVKTAAIPLETLAMAPHVTLLLCKKRTNGWVAIYVGLLFIYYGIQIFIDGVFIDYSFSSLKEIYEYLKSPHPLLCGRLVIFNSVIPASFCLAYLIIDFYFRKYLGNGEEVSGQEIELEDRT